jgi:hypothetical protein
MRVLHVAKNYSMSDKVFGVGYASLPTSFDFWIVVFWDMTPSDLVRG